MCCRALNNRYKNNSSNTNMFIKKVATYFSHKLTIIGPSCNTKMKVKRNKFIKTHH